MVLSHVIAVEPGSIVGPDELQPIRVLLREVGLRAIHVVENAELHVVLLSTTLGSLTERTRHRRGLRSGEIEARPR
jgi:hypothetical protein